jgi:hypothetical protein
VTEFLMITASWADIVENIVKEEARAWPKKTVFVVWAANTGNRASMFALVGAEPWFLRLMGAQSLSA